VGESPVTVQVCLPVSHLLQTPEAWSNGMAAGVDVLELRTVRPWDYLPERPRVFHWGEGAITHNFVRQFEAQQLGPFLHECRAELFSFDLGPACQKNMSTLPLSPTLNPDRIMSIADESLSAVRRKYNGRLAVENYNYYPTGLYEHICDPNFISKFLETFDLGMVLDLAHARVTAYNRNLNLYDYLIDLPLERVVELHISRPYFHDHLAVDAHLPPEGDDYAILDFVLSRLDKNQPVLVVAECYQDLNTVKNQYRRLRQTADHHNAKANQGRRHRSDPVRLMSPTERLSRKNAFDGSLVMGTATFNKQTGRDRHRADPLEGLLDPDTGLIRENLVRPRTCPLCGHTDTNELFVKKGFHHVRCQNCRLIYVNPVLTDDAARKLYEQESSWVQVLDSGPQKEMDQKKFSYGLDIVSPYLCQRRILDIGTGTGLFLEVARDKGFDPVGLELNRATVDRLRENGFEIIDKPMENSDLPENDFDLVTLWEVLEHIMEPGQLLAHITSVLKPGGMLLVLVPNADSLVTRILHGQSGTFGGHSHVNHFNSATLTRLLNSAGFEILETETLITEIGAIHNHLDFQDPYLGQAAPAVDFLTPKRIHDNLLGSKLLMIARLNESKEAQ
jgi:uncharacterized protein (UPF0276 family)/2-polyprenyl-3-methyl-5-hydroxy-6-metoxy-1,4-benzoquinol methylase